MGAQNHISAKLWALAGGLALVLTASLASAQGAWSTPPPPTTSFPSKTVEQQEPPSQAKQQAKHRGYQGAFHIGVPIWLNIDRDVVRPGADLYGFGGYDMGYVVFGLSLGVMWVPINFNNIPEAPPGSSYDRRPMTRLYFAPEFRVQVPNKSPVLLHVGITFDANWWRVAATDIVCGAFYCVRTAVFRFTPGMTATLGLAFRVSTGAHIDVGVKYSLSGAGSFFLRREQWVTPYIGMLFR